jgi:hypothetical protein
MNGKELLDLIETRKRQGKSIHSIKAEIYQLFNENLEVVI